MTNNASEIEPEGRAPAEAGVAAAEVDPQLVAEVREAVGAVLKAARAAHFYVPGNPLIEKFAGEARQCFSALWERLPHLSLVVDESRLLWRGEEVYSEALGPDNFAFHLFKDGIRVLAFLPGMEGEELREFLDLVRLGKAGGEADDVLTTLWHRDFSFIRFEYVDLSAEEEGIEVPAPDRAAGEGEKLEDLSEIEEVVDGGEIPAEEALDLGAVYLSDADQAYLRREMEAEWQRSLNRDVTLALLDQFEMRDHDRRRQVVDILREFLPRLLSERDFSDAALILNELQLLANRTGEVTTQELVTALLRDMSEAVAEMVAPASEGGATPDEVSALLGALQAEAIPTLVRAIPAVSNLKTRRQLTHSLDRLVGAHPQQIIGLLRSDDPVLAGEAARIVARLRIAEAEPELVRLVKRPEEPARQAAIEALTALGSRAGAQALFTALEDASREVRLSAARAISELKPEGADRVMLGWIGGADLRERDPTEQMAFLKAYALVAGESGARVLDGLLNGRRWYGGRHPPSVRASAARALGMLGTDEARRALEKAAGDRNAQVRSAVRVSLRALAGEEEQ
ncbi:MAG: HEAT repeat domain-containing protein [Gemmatimonadota bacterium]